jgi:glycosyltransferase involved in cell wall biosynthesis
MRVLVVSGGYPMLDRSAGELRFSKIVDALSGIAETDFCALRAALHAKRLGSEACEAYRRRILDLGVTDVTPALFTALKRKTYDVLFFEYYFNADRMTCDMARFSSPRSRIIIDSVDVHFNRLIAKARVTGSADDEQIAQAVRNEELCAYRRADLVVAVSNEDKAAIAKEDESIAVEIVPTFHSLHPPDAARERIPNSLIFIGAFRHTPNVDAVLYFVRDIMPLVLRHVPDLRLTIVGSDPPPELRSLESASIRVTGFVADTTPYLHSHAVSVAPLRYGGGLKGKVGEAMAHGLPVVTTSMGAEGFGVRPGEHVLVGDGPAEFAAHVLSLLRDPSLRERVASAGYEFVSRNFSDDSVLQRVKCMLEHVQQVRPRRLSLRTRLRLRAQELYERHLGWRFPPSTGESR